MKSCENHYKKFVGMDFFPDYKVKSKEITIQKSQQQGFDSVAAVFYDVSTGIHAIEIWSQLYLPQMNAEYLVFHELTHILDAEMYSQKDNLKHISNKGYTKYHSAQIDFMKLLNAENIDHPFSFKMSQPFETFAGKTTAAQFVEMPREHAI